MKKFSVWLEEKDYIQDSILGIFGGQTILGDQEQKHLLNRNTDEFSNELLNKVINLGVVKNNKNFIGIKNMIKNGVLIKDLIEKLKGENYAPNARIELNY